MRRARHTAALGALLLLAAAPAAAHATDGAIYAIGSSAWSARVAATVHPGPTWLVQVPALNPAGTGDYWQMQWLCPAPGSEITRVEFSALRTQAPSSLAVAVTDGRQALWIEGDAGMPQSPNGGRSYGVNLPGGQCDVRLTLTQMEERAQHARGYFIGGPRALVRDLAPPAVVLRSLPSGWINGGVTTARVVWAVADNFGGDGTASQRVLLSGGTRWTGAPGVGDHAVDLPLAGFGDGAHRVVVEVDGDGTAGAATEGVIHIDRTAPVARDLSATPTAAGATLRWSVDDNLSGVGAGQAQVNAARDGSATGTWVTVASATGRGPHAATVPVRLADGVHAWRVVASDGAGNPGVTAAVDRIAVDTTPPTLELHGVPAGWVRALDLELTATDNLQAALGLGATQVDVNAAADGGEGGAWITRASAPGPPGHRVVPVDLAGLADGRHLMRVLVRNGGPFGQTLAAERRATIRVDRSPPSLSRVSFTPRAGGLTVAWVSGDALAGMETATLQVRDEAGWRTLASRRAADGAGGLSADVSSVVKGPRTFRLVAGDAAGNVATAEGQVRLAGRDAFARLRGARLSMAVPGARRSRIGGRRALVSRIAIGRTVTMAGLLRDARGRPIAGAEVQARGHRGALVGRALTRRDGRFRLVARPLAGGPLRIGVPAGRDLLPARAPAVVLEVKPRVSLAASSTSAAPGQPVAFSGRLTPAPADIGLGSRKSVVLEWHDPLRRTWRPVVNARIRSDGTFAIPWSFNLSGLTIPMRVSIPAEVGWPLLPVRSGVIPVVVGGSPAAR